MAQARACLVNERWRQVGELFEAALERDPPERAAWVRAAQAEPEVRDEVLSLLAAHESAGTFLDQPARVGVETPAPEPDADRESDRLQLLEAGTDVGPYRIVGVIGQGGMGVVYLAEDTRLHRQVALKSLPARLARDERLRQRLRQEARAAAALTHPGIATVFALEELDDQVFIVSEYLRGDTLRAEMARGPLGAAHVVATALEIARAMAAAHERGIVHRDLKPENVLRTMGGALKILDFGLAQFEAPARDLASWTKITEPGLVAGTPAYMAPEQLLARPTDARTDQFAFGVLVYELASGRHPFGGASLPSTIAHILTAEPQSPVESDQMGNGLWPIVERCLQKAPADRFASTADLVRALEDTASHVRAPWAVRPASGAVTREASTSSRAIALPDSPLSGDSDAAWWWRFHQLAAALVYWSMVWPAWHVRTWLGPPGLLWFLALLACIVVAGNLRIHLWFSSRIYPSELRGQRTSVGTWIRWADWGFAALLVSSGLALVQDHTGWGALFVAVGVGTAMSFLFMEPGTARAAFRE